MSSSKRIARELSDIITNPPENTTVALAPPESDIHNWHATVRGPPSTPYADGVFGIVVNLPHEYPFKPPAVRFATRIYHPNVTNDSLGNVCLAMLKSENWKPSSHMRGVLEALLSLLADPQPDDPLETRIAEQFTTNRLEFETTARQYVDQYAKGQPSFAELVV